jgi:hypothetical protein
LTVAAEPSQKTAETPWQQAAEEGAGRGEARGGALPLMFLFVNQFQAVPTLERGRFHAGAVV